MMKTARGQTTVEMIVVVGFIMLIFIVVLVTANIKAVESNDLKAELDAKRVVRSVASNVNTIAEQGPGYYRFFSLPEYLFGYEPYDIIAYRNFVEINWSNRYGEQVYSIQVITSNVSNYCVEHGGGNLTKVFNYEGRVLLTCNRPDLIVTKDSQECESGIVSVEAFNYGALPAENVEFVLKIKGDTDTYTTVASIGADRKEEVSFAVGISGTHIMNVTIDPSETLKESFTGDNFYNATVTCS